LAKSKTNPYLKLKITKAFLPRAKGQSILWKFRKFNARTSSSQFFYPAELGV